MHSSFSESVLRIWCLHQTIFLCSKSHAHDKLNLQLTYYRITVLNIYQYFILNRKIRGECTIDGKINKPTQWLRWCLQFLWYNIIQFPVIIGNLIMLYHNIIIYYCLSQYVIIVFRWKTKWKWEEWWNATECSHLHNISSSHKNDCSYIQSTFWPNFWNFWLNGNHPKLDNHLTSCTCLIKLVTSSFKALCTFCGPFSSQLQTLWTSLCCKSNKQKDMYILQNGPDLTMSTFKNNLIAF